MTEIAPRWGRRDERQIVGEWKDVQATLAEHKNAIQVYAPGVRRVPGTDLWTVDIRLLPESATRRIAVGRARPVPPSQTTHQHQLPQWARWALVIGVSAIACVAAGWLAVYWLSPPEVTPPAPTQATRTTTDDHGAMAGLVGALFIAMGLTAIVRWVFAGRRSFSGTFRGTLD